MEGDTRVDGGMALFCNSFILHLVHFLFSSFLFTLMKFMNMLIPFDCYVHSVTSFMGKGGGAEECNYARGNRECLIYSYQYGIKTKAIANVL